MVPFLLWFLYSFHSERAEILALFQVVKMYQDKDQWKANLNCRSKKPASYLLLCTEAIPFKDKTGFLNPFLKLELWNSETITRLKKLFFTSLLCKKMSLLSLTLKSLLKTIILGCFEVLLTFFSFPIIIPSASFLFCNNTDWQNPQGKAAQDKEEKLFATTLKQE